MIVQERHTKIVDANKLLDRKGLKLKKDQDGKKWCWFVFVNGERGRFISSLLVNDLDTKQLVALVTRYANPDYTPPIPLDVRGKLIRLGDTVAVGLNNGSTLFCGIVTALSEYVWVRMPDGTKARRIPKRVAVLENAK